MAVILWAACCMAGMADDEAERLLEDLLQGQKGAGCGETPTPGR